MENPSLHLLETSFLRHLFTGNKIYRDELRNRVDEERSYVTPYIQMETRRSLVIWGVKLFFIMDLPSNETVLDGLLYASNTFKPRELKAYVQLFASFLHNQGAKIANPNKKEELLLRYAEYLKRLDQRLEFQYKPDDDETKCHRAKVGLWEVADLTSLDSIRATFKSFQESFDDKEICRSKCSIEKLIFLKKRSLVEMIVGDADSRPTGDSQAKGYKKVGKDLSGILTKGASKLTCDYCSRIGDAVISLNGPNYMQLEHLDHAYDYLCEIAEQPHRKHEPPPVP